jgi:hypothetical protein
MKPKTFDETKIQKTKKWPRVNLPVVLILTFAAFVAGYFCSSNPTPKTEAGVSVSDSTRIAENSITANDKAEEEAAAKKREEATKKFASAFDATIEDLDYASFPVTKYKLNYDQIKSSWDPLTIWNIRYMYNVINYEVTDSIKKEIETNAEGFFNFLEENKGTIKAGINFAGKTEVLKDMYENIAKWTTGEKDKKTSKIKEGFSKFFKKYGELEAFPWRSDTASDETAKNFWRDMDKISKIDPGVFKRTEVEVPEIYKEYLFSKRWQKKIGKGTYRKIVKVIHEILY